MSCTVTKIIAISSALASGTLFVITAQRQLKNL